MHACMEHACMHGLENENTQSIDLALNDGDEVSVMQRSAPGGRPLAKALGDRAHHLLRPVDVSL